MAAIKLPPLLSKVVQVFGVVGMLIGVGLAYFNQSSLGWGIFCTVGTGFLFAVGAKYFIVKWMYFWMATKLEVAAKEKEEAKKLELAKREERRKKAEEESAKIRAELAAATKAQSKPTT